MIKFHQIPTEHYKPLSFENSYLFNHYDKISNFIALQLGPGFKSMIAKPILNEYNIEWYSKYNNLKKIELNNNKIDESNLLKYWEFIDLLNEKIELLANSNDENSKNWSYLLKTTFNPEDNILFSNGQQCCIIWGWKFENKELYRPILSKQGLQIDIINNIENENTSENITKIEEIKIEKKDPINNIKVIEDVKKMSFIDFLKWIASKYWWFLTIIYGVSFLIIVLKIFYYNL